MRSRNTPALVVGRKSKEQEYPRFAGSTVDLAGGDRIGVVEKEHGLFRNLVTDDSVTLLVEGHCKQHRNLLHFVSTLLLLQR